MSRQTLQHPSGVELAAAMGVGAIALLMIGVQPILLGALVDARQVSLEGVGLVAMGEIITIGLGVLLGDLWLSAARLRSVTVMAAIAVALLDLLTVKASGDGPMIGVRAAAGLAEGLLIWGTTAVIVRSHHPARVGGIFFVVQTLAQALFGFLLARLIIPLAGWQGAFAALAGLSLLPGILAWVQPRGLAPLAAPTTSGSRWSPAAILPLTIVFLQMATLGSFWAYLEPLGKAAGLDAQGAQTLIAFVLVTQVLGGTLASMAVKRFAVAPTLVVASLALLVITLSVYSQPTGSTEPFMAACLCFGFVWLFMLPFHLALALRADPSGHLAVLVPAAQLLGSAFGPLTASFIVDGDNAGAVPLLSSAFALASALLILGVRRAISHKA